MGPVRRAIDRILPKVAAAVLDFLVGPLLESPGGSAGRFAVIWEASPRPESVRTG